jgi:hypothetical protein
MTPGSTVPSPPPSRPGSPSARCVQGVTPPAPLPPAVPCTAGGTTTGIPGSECPRPLRDHTAGHHWGALLPGPGFVGIPQPPLRHHQRWHVLLGVQRTGAGGGWNHQRPDHPHPGGGGAELHPGGNRMAPQLWRDGRQHRLLLGIQPEGPTGEWPDHNIHGSHPGPRPCGHAAPVQAGGCRRRPQLRPGDGRSALLLGIQPPRAGGGRNHRHQDHTRGSGHR